MLNKMKNWVFTRNYNLKDWQDHLKRMWFSDANHGWLTSDRYIKASIEDFIEMLPVKVLKFLVESEVSLVLSTGQYGLSLRSRANRGVILVFPELKRMLSLPLPTDGFVVLAHEIGHLYYGHHDTAIDPLEAQVEADQFAVELGLGEDLESFLLDLPESTEKRVRLSHLTVLTAKNQ